MRYPAANIQRQLQGLLEPRPAAAATVVSTPGAHHVVLTLAPLRAARLFRQGPRALWETRVYVSEPPPKVGLGARPHYAVFDADRAQALRRHEELAGRLEAGSFARETGREILGAMRASVDLAAEAYRAGDLPGAVAALDSAIAIAGRLDGTRTFLPLYQEVFLMRALALERIDPAQGKRAYRDFIALCAGLAPCRPETLRGVAWAREAVERLTPSPGRERSRQRWGDRGGASEGVR